MKLFSNLQYRFNTLCEQVTAVLRVLVNVQNSLTELVKKKQETPLVVVARHTLGALDVSDVTDPDGVEDKEYVEYTARAVQFYDFFIREAEHMMKLQHDYWFTNAESWEQTMFGRGTMNGIQLLIDRFTLLRNKHFDLIKKEEEPPIGSREEILQKLQMVETTADDGVEQ